MLQRKQKQSREQKYYKNERVVYQINRFHGREVAFLGSHGCVESVLRVRGASMTVTPGTPAQHKIAEK